MKKRKIPMRKCISCQENKPKKELTRIVRTPDGEAVVDPTGKVSGRGAYICGEPNCLENIEKKNTIEKHLNIKVDPSIYEELRNNVKASNNK